jgi:hypothetical protein
MPPRIEAHTGLQAWDTLVLTRRPAPEPLGEVVNESLSCMGETRLEV